MNRKTVVAALGVLASIATILTFLVTVANRTSTPTQPAVVTPGVLPSPAASAASTSPTVSPTSPSTIVSPGPAVSGYPSSAVNSFLATCVQYTGLPTAHCQCDLSWVETQAPYSASFTADELAWVEEAEDNADCP